MESRGLFVCLFVLWFNSLASNFSVMPGVRYHLNINQFYEKLHGLQPRHIDSEYNRPPLSHLAPKKAVFHRILNKIADSITPRNRPRGY